MSLMTKRILKELEQLRNDPPSSFVAQCINNNLYEWHFTIRGPEDSDYQEGIYHGKIELPVDYPIKPPNIYFLTPNGRFEVKTKICLSITKFHPENWNPSWTIRTMIEGIIQHFHVSDFAVGSIKYTSTQIKSLAQASHTWECDLCGPISKQIAPKIKQEQKEEQPQPQPKKEEQPQSKKDEQIQDRNEDKKPEITNIFNLKNSEQDQQKSPQAKEQIQQQQTQMSKQVEQKQKREGERKREMQMNDCSDDDEQEIPMTKSQKMDLEKLLWKAMNPDFLQTQFSLRTQNQQFGHCYPQQLQYFDQIYKMMEEEEKAQKSLVLNKQREQDVNKREAAEEVEKPQVVKINNYQSQIKLINLILWVLIFGIVFVNFGEQIEQKFQEWLLIA
ncbi:unnamed protein product [Paramecium octaurelia]|uniref:UBC core domain-containing protein n=1 Tax=Paramecium octaurelia TaxID=43137 RepID=A0A8S1WT37_PAROT|nr:unnamed protein product [Paramecium octaurelia]